MKRYNRYVSLNTQHAIMKSKEGFTEWIVLTKDDDKVKVLRPNEVLSRWKDVVELKKKYPNPFTTSEGEFIPVLSTKRGWKWNRKQILKYLPLYTNMIASLLNSFLLDGVRVVILKKIFGTHLNSVLREISNYTPTIFRGAYRLMYNFTPKKISKREKQQSLGCGWDFDGDLIMMVKLPYQMGR